MLVVADATPLHALIRLGLSELLATLYGQVVIPPAVASELSHARAPTEVRDWIKNPPTWLSIRRPASVDPTLVSGATSVISMADLFGLYLQRGLVEIALLGGAQIDRYGNLNSTVIGDYAKPKTRLPGSGGACEIATNAQRTFMIMRLKRRAFVGKLDFLTSPGHLTGGDSRARLGLPGGGPELVITDKAILNFDNSDREMQLTHLYPGVTLENIQAEVGWPLRVAETIQEIAAPSAEELRLIREEVDPHAMYR